MKKINFLKCIALSAAALMVFSLSGCDYISKIIGGLTGEEGEIGGGSETPELTLSETEISVTVGQSVQLTATANDGATVSWSSYDSNIATVVDGLVTGVTVGETIIIAETEALLKTCTVKVTSAQTTPPTETLTLSQTSLNMIVGDTATLTATCSIAGATIKWTALPSSYVSVVNGKVTALKAGNAMVWATVGTLQAGCQVTVKNPDGADKNGYTLVWNDEFNGTSLDMTKWNYQTGIRDIYHEFDTQNWNWGNSEQQYYTEDAVSVSGGSLKITARKQEKDGKPYTSGRIVTRDKASWTYGYFEAKMKSPTGNGMWPAFWMLPQPSSYANTNNKYGGWPYSGEIDIMEAKGRLYNKIDNTLHFGPATEGGWQSHYVSNKNNAGGYQLSSNIDQWHTYAVDWTANAITWYVDGKVSMSMSSSEWYTRSSASTGASSPFDQPFYILLNLAVGGTYDLIELENGDPNRPVYAQPADTFTSATMEVDYVRVYTKN